MAQAVATAQLVFDMGTELGHHMHLLDLGGGFPGTEDTTAPLEEVQTSQPCPQQAENELGMSLPAQFPAGQEEGSFFPSQIAAGINSALDLYFPEGSGVDIVARPGRYYVTSAFTLAVSITALEEIPVEQPGSDGRCDSRTCPLPP